MENRGGRTRRILAALAISSSAILSGCSGSAGVPPRSGGASTATVSTAPAPAVSTSFAMPPSSDTADLLAQFGYDATQPLENTSAAPEEIPAGTLRAISFASPHDGRASGFITEPLGVGPFAAVVLMPGSNAAPGTMRLQAIELTRLGAIALVIDQSQTRPGHRPLFTFTPADRDEFIQTVIDLRRAIDLLAARGNVDRTRIAYWGFSHGALLGGLLAGVDTRVRAFVLQSGGGADYMLQNAPRQISDPAALAAYRAAIATVDPTRYVSHAAPAALLLQNGRLDHTYSQDAVAAWVAAASAPKDVQSYPADHLLSAQANTDALGFLARQLRLGTR